MSKVLFAALALFLAAPLISVSQAEEVERLDTLVLSRIRSAPNLGSYSIQVTSGKLTSSRREFKRSQSEVLLEGTVSTREVLERVEEIAASTPGVTRVTNNLVVADQAASKPLKTTTLLPGIDQVSDEELKDRVTFALNADGIDLSNIAVTAERGRITFTGVRNNHREIDSILSNALMVPGVIEVKSQLTLR